MNLMPGSIVALTAAQPGWTVTIEWSNCKHEDEHYPIVAWAAVVMESGRNGLAGTRLEPVFFHTEYGVTYGESEYCSDMAAASFGRAKLTFAVNPPADGGA